MRLPARSSGTSMLLVKRRAGPKASVDTGSLPVRPLSVVALLLLSGCASALPSASPSSSPSPSALPTPSPTPEPGTFGDLPTIVLDEDDLEPGETIDSLDVGLGALLQPVGLLENSTLAEQPGFVDARMTRIGIQGQDSYWEVGGYVSWAAVYATDADAETAFEVLVAEHESDTGWAMERVGRPPYGDEAVSLAGAAYGWDTNRLHVWRQANVLLAGGALGVTATSEDTLARWEAIVRTMDAATAPESSAGQSRAYTSADLASIVVAQDTAPEGLLVEEGDSGLAALTLPLHPDRDTPLDTTAFVDALTTNIEHSTTGGYTSWAALFETADAAERAFEFIANQHESEDGWGLQPSRSDLDLGDESVYYTGPAYGWPTAGIYFWRESNLLLAAVGTEAYDPELLRSIAEGMGARAG